MQAFLQIYTTQEETAVSTHICYIAIHKLPHVYILSRVLEIIATQATHGQTHSTHTHRRGELVTSRLLLRLICPRLLRLALALILLARSLVGAFSDGD